MGQNDMILNHKEGVGRFEGVKVGSEDGVIVGDGEVGFWLDTGLGTMEGM